MQFTEGMTDNVRQAIPMIRKDAFRLFSTLEICVGNSKIQSGRDCETQDGLNLRTKQIEKEAGVRCCEQAFSSEKEA